MGDTALHIRSVDNANQDLCTYGYPVGYLDRDNPTPKFELVDFSFGQMEVCSYVKAKHDPNDVFVPGLRGPWRPKERDRSGSAELVPAGALNLCWCGLHMDLAGPEKSSPFPELPEAVLELLVVVCHSGKG